MKNPYKVVRDFENTIADYFGSKFAIAIDNCTNAIFLCCKYLEVNEVTIPKETFISVPQSIMHAGGIVKFKKVDWFENRYYQLEPYPIYDSARNFQKKSYIKNSFFCISFSANKPINIGKGGMILCDNKEAYEWFQRSIYFGKDSKKKYSNNIESLGWNMYMTPEQASRGLQLMYFIDERITNKEELHYEDLSKIKIFN